jgi:hypothetical protein
MATRWRSPPESDNGRRVAYAADKPTSASSDAIRSGVAEWLVPADAPSASFRLLALNGLNRPRREMGIVNDSRRHRVDADVVAQSKDDRDGRHFTVE